MSLSDTLMSRLTVWCADCPSLLFRSHPGMGFPALSVPGFNTGGERCCVLPTWF